ncbi:hypothetical protein ACJ72_07589 [Emergomyces africanus]|uniref:DUF7730 domain-containing protein n=1 Tax=Emergomyces africanus TaxID=1955775 RepID=A0A1B7NN63_9EURO|nr:hypothetical protein ACJ72_07589 [Emergomyces africanus]
MVVKAILHGLKLALFFVLTCLLLPIYSCFVVRYATKKAAAERRAEELMDPIWGLAANTEERRMLSITPSMLEEGHPGAHHEHGGKNTILNGSSTSAKSKRTTTTTSTAAARLGKLVPNLPYPKALGASSKLFSFSLASSSGTTSPPLFKKQLSPFFTRLPLEIRRAIYHHALSCYRVHVVRVRGKVASFACPEGIEKGFVCFKGGCEDYHCLSIDAPNIMRAWVGQGVSSFGDLAHRIDVAPVTFCAGATRGIAGALDLLSVCRQVYTEAITVLYKNLTFQMDLITLLAFSISIPEHHLKAITKLEISGPQLNYIDSGYYLQYLPSFRRIRRRPTPQQPSSPTLPTTAQQANDDSHPSPLPPSPDLYRINRKLTCFTRYRAEDIPVYTPRAPTAWEETCNQLLPRMAGLCELRISLKRPWRLRERCMSPASERYLLRPLVDKRLRETTLPFLRVFEVRVDWEEGLEEHMWNETGLWPVPQKPVPPPGSEVEMLEMLEMLEGQEGQEGQEPEMEEVDMWRPSALLLEKSGQTELLVREGWEPWRDEQWDSFLVKKKAGGRARRMKRMGTTKMQMQMQMETEMEKGGDYGRMRRSQ